MCAGMFPTHTETRHYPRSTISLLQSGSGLNQSQGGNYIGQ